METGRENRSDPLAEREAEEAAAEAARIGGKSPVDSEDPAERPLAEAGEGESEGFELAELAERRLREIAEHGDQHRFPDRDAPPAEEREEAERGEADEAIPPDE